MKTRFNTYDVVCGVTELQKLVGQRVNQIYDVDNKTYLIRFQVGTDKVTLLLESGSRFHTTAFQWPKSMAPSGFSMKLRKHLNNKRLESVQQLGADRIVDFKFGSGEASYHVIHELYDRGNIILTDHELTILYILRPHTEGEELLFAVREKYPTNRAKSLQEPLTLEKLQEHMSKSKGESLQTFLVGAMDCGPAVIEHVLTKYELNHCVFENKCIEDADNDKIDNKKKSKKQKKGPSLKSFTFKAEENMQQLLQAIQEANDLLEQAKVNESRGYIIKKKEEKVNLSNEEEKEHIYQNIEFHPYLFKQFENEPISEFPTFMLAVDEYYSNLEAQRIDMKTLQQEREMWKKLQNVKQDHSKRLDELNKAQEKDRIMADLIIHNRDLVENCLRVVRVYIANQMSWDGIQDLIKIGKSNGDPVSVAIKNLKLDKDIITVLLSGPYGNDSEDVNLLVDLDLKLSAWSNARQYYDLKRSASQKEQKTLAATQKALKSAERKTQQTLKDVRTVSAITKARKVFWFEKFFWFISSENYLVIAGRDAQQNELLVKRYLRQVDIYVHAEIQGASSVIVRNHTTDEIPPKTLLEAGTMAISYSVSWDAKVATNAYWVRANQVSKTAPSGEYLGTGSFMIRGKKNFLPFCHMIMGLSLLFKLDDSCLEKHRGERRIRNFDEEDTISQVSGIEETEEIKLASESESEGNDDEEEEEERKNEIKFPDTHIKIEHNKNIGTTHRVSKKHEIEEEEETAIIAPAPTRVKQQSNSKKKKEQKTKEKQIKIEKIVVKQKENESRPNKRRKGKLNKMKDNYEDDADNELQILANMLERNVGKIDDEEKQKSDEKTVNVEVEKEKEEEKLENEEFEEKTVKQVIFVEIVEKNNEKKIEKSLYAEEELEDTPLGADTEVLESLTGQPLDDDELLFVVPVVAPYQALQNYKFKVKLTPGTGKRGRAAKTALLIFSKDKNCGPREKDLLKSLKDEALARNIPGKVKVTAPQLQKFKK